MGQRAESLNEYLISALLGVIEGLTEFLPVSSTAHLRIAEALLGINLGDGYWKMFTIVIQLGAILCLPLYFARRIGSLLATFPGGVRGDRNFVTHPLTLTLIAFVCTALPSLLLVKVIGKNLESLFVMGTSLVLGGVIMWAIDARFGNRPGEAHTQPQEEVEQISFWRAVWIGLCQTLSAVFPGASRSMTTIAAGQVSGLSRAAALEFSFLLSIPTMAAATGYDLLKSLRASHTGAESAVGMGPIDFRHWVLLAIGFVISFIVALAVVAWFMRWVRSRGFVPFAVYRILAGSCILAWALAG
jgi:undecaprenyl-diphosphatase